MTVPAHSHTPKVSIYEKLGNSGKVPDGSIVMMQKARYTVAHRGS